MALFGRKRRSFGPPYGGSDLLTAVRDRTGAWGRIARVLARLALFILILTLPFFVLVRASVFFYLRAGLPVWVSIAFAIGATALLLLAYLARAGGSVSTRAGKVMLGFVAVYCLYALVYIGPGNVQKEAMRETYGSLHPILRLATSTLTVFDRRLVVTGTSRVREDYSRLGLPAREHSLHYRQSTGYSHAVDLRTQGRGFVRVLLMRAYFELLGFNTLRHVGNADHLHVSLPVP